MPQIIEYLKKTYDPLFKERVLEYMERLSEKTLEELQNDVAWCEKMALRTERRDAEGIFRWHWILRDSLEIFCDNMRCPYRGPKKSLKWMKTDHPKEFGCYVTAMSHYDVQTLKEWVECLKEKLEKRAEEI